MEKFKYSTNYEVELILTWSKNSVLADMTVRAAQGDNPAIVAPLGLESQITETKLYVPVVKGKWHKTFRTVKIRI